MMARQMKDSGVEWIGKIPEKWSIRKLKAIITCRDGERVPIDSGLRESGPYPYWGAGNITDYVNDYLFDEELVLLGEDGAPFFDKKRNVAFLVQGKIWVNNHIHVLKADKEVISSYLVHFLNVVDFGSYINGSILNKLTQSNMNRINVVFPNKYEQQKIADFLDEKVGEIDSVISKTRETIEDYKKYKQAIITETVTKGLNPDVEMKDSKLQWVDEIPKHWKEQKILHIISIPVIDGPHVSPELVDEGVPYISADAIENGKINFDRKRGYISKEYSEECNKRYKPQKDDILVVKLGASTGKMGIVGDDTYFNIWVPLAVVRCKDDIVPKYIFYSMESIYFKNEIKNGWTFGTQETLGVKTLEQLKVFVPPFDEQKEIANFLDEKCSEIDKLIAKKEELLTDLESYKKSLIYEYVTGKKEI